MSVDDELEAFEDNLINVLDYQFVVRPNWAYWEEMDAPNTEFFDELDQVIDQAFHPLMNKYRDTHVTEVLVAARQLLRIVVRASMDVPFPRNPELHATRVVDNLMAIYTASVYARLRTEMTMVNHHVNVIQRTWKKAVTDPRHPICRRRLMYEFGQLESMIV